MILSLLRHDGITFHVRRALDRTWLLDDQGVRVATIEPGSEIRVVAAGGSTVASIGPDTSQDERRSIARIGDRHYSIAARSGEVRAVEKPGGLRAIFSYPRLQLRSAIHEAVRSGGGRPFATIQAAGMGVRVAFGPTADDEERMLAIVLYAASLRCRIPPPSCARYLLPRTL